VFNIIILGVASFFTDIASEMGYPLIPFFLAELCEPHASVEPGSATPAS